MSAKVSVDPPSMDFRLGWPNPNLLPVNLLTVASQAALAKREAYTRESLLEYGPDDGYKPLRMSIAQWMNTFYQPQKPVHFDRICITGGASQSLACVLQTFADPMVTKNIWCVAPVYFCACRTFDDHGFAGKLRAIREDEEGIDISQLESELHRSIGSASALARPSKTARSWNKAYQHIIYAVPTFANPSGRIMSLRRREMLVRLARQFDALIITDDVYDMLIWDQQSARDFNIRTKACQPRLVDVDAYLDGGPIDEFGHCVSQGSFSKIMGPGLRTGWAEATPRFAYGLSQTGQTRSGGSGSQFAAAILSEIVQTGIPQYLHTELLPVYARRYYTLIQAIEQFLKPLGVTTHDRDGSGVAGGYYVWLDFPPTAQADLVKARAAEKGVFIHVGNLFVVEGDHSLHQKSFLNGCRICFVWVKEDFLVEGMKVLAKVVQQLM